MTNTLMVTAGDNPTQDLMEVSTAMKTYISNENDSVLEMAVARMNQNPSLWRRMFPDAFDREQKKITLDRVRSAYAAKKGFLDAYVNVQMDIARRRGDALIAAVGMDLRAKLAVFAKEKIDGLTQTLIASKDNYYQRIAAHMRGLQQYADIPELHDSARQSAVREIKSYLEWVEGLREGFTDALKAKVATKD